MPSNFNQSVFDQTFSLPDILPNILIDCGSDINIHICYGNNYVRDILTFKEICIDMRYRVVCHIREAKYNMRVVDVSIY